MIYYIGNVKMRPQSTREDPWKFLSITDACAFARISSRPVWATISDADDSVFRVYPGGRVEQWAPRGKRPFAAVSAAR